MYSEKYWVEVTYNNGQTDLIEQLTYGQLHTMQMNFARDDNILSMKNGKHLKENESSTKE